MLLGNYLGMDDCNHAKLLHSLSQSVLAADYEIPVPPPSPDICKMLPLPTPHKKEMEKEKDGSNIGGLLMDLAKDRPGDGTSTPTKKEASTIPPVHMENDAAMTQVAPTKIEAGRIPPTAIKTASCTFLETGMQAGTNPDMPTDPMLMDTS